MNNQSKVVTTGDGSNTLYDTITGEHYHSLYGAVSESLHVFIKAGLSQFLVDIKEISILEIGFGTGLNTLLSFQSCKGRAIVYYEAVDCYPLAPEDAIALNYWTHSDLEGLKSVIEHIHLSEWNKNVLLSEDFTLFKRCCRIEEYIPENEVFNLIYFDAFSPSVQPELWTEEVFRRLYHSLKSGGLLVTYSSRGTVKQALRAAGFSLERLQGPMGKRHMLRATKAKLQPER
jgi:tRNA U34 5-methylaminomethyl-2-thiouridine-forming methyltransferase MnmC